MYALCVSGAVNTQGFVWKFFYVLHINFDLFIHSLHDCCCCFDRQAVCLYG